jgi:hypothetical protein
MSIFEFSLKKFAGRVVWPALRKPRILALVDVLLHPLRQLQTELRAFIDAKRVELTYTGQTILLQKYLNDRFDAEQIRIIVIHNDGGAALYLYNETEGQAPKYLYNESEISTPVYLYFEGETGTAFIEDFQVHIPADLASIQEQIRQAVKKYKIAGVTYSVV